MEIFVYFQDESDRIRELRLSTETGEWYEDSPAGMKLLKGLSGTSLACAAHQGSKVYRWVFSHSTEREVQGRVHFTDGENTGWSSSTW